MGRWHFRQHDGYADINQSSSAEAFEGTALKGLATSVVRESLQNVLDVPLYKLMLTRVRVALGICGRFESIGSIWFQDLMHYLKQPGAGAPEPT